MRKSIILLVLGFVVFTYGATRFYVVTDFVTEYDRLTRSFFSSLSVADIPEASRSTILSGLSEIRMRISHHNGSYNGYDGFLLTTGFAFVCLAASRYFFLKHRNSIGGDSSRSKKKKTNDEARDRAE
jgi:hypothetical protein